MYIFEIYQSLCLLIAVDNFCAVVILGSFQCFVSMQVQMPKLLWTHHCQFTIHELVFQQVQPPLVL